MNRKVAVISGSLRRESFNTKLAKAFIAAAPASLEAQLVDISALPLQNEDLEQNLPEAVRTFQNAIRAVDAVLLLTPEHNRSFSAAIKNALDWGSRPHGVNLWDGKLAGVAGCTPYNLGTFGAQQHLRQVLMYLNMQPLQQPEFYLEHAAEKFDANGRLTDTKTQQKIAEFWQAFSLLIDKIY
jgi:chromate reductase